MWKSIDIDNVHVKLKFNYVYSDMIDVYASFDFRTTNYYVVFVVVEIVIMGEER